LISSWQISGGAITEWLPSLLFAFSALASAWVLHDARRRFPAYAVAAWTLATLVYAPIVLPLYLVACLFKPHHDAAPETTTPLETDVADLTTTGGDGLEETGAPGTVAARGESTGDPGQEAAPRPSPLIRASLRVKRYGLPIIYASALLSAGAVYFYRHYHSFDAHLVRATDARLLNRRDAAIREYRAALRHADDAHTHKLLGLLLAEDGRMEAALAEFRAAERGGEPDELLPYRIASALSALGRATEAAGEYQKFVQGSLCARPPADARCVEASARLRQIREGGVSE
jgi:hypothetical protein